MLSSARIDMSQIDDLARRLSQLVPPPLRGESAEALRAELQENFKSALQAGLGKLALVTREEFDVQRGVLRNTRERLDLLRKEVEALEARLAQRGESDA